MVQPGVYGAINTDDTTTNGLYIIQFLSEEYTQNNNTAIDGQVISAGELVAKAKYPCSMQENTNWCCKNNHCNSISQFQHAQYFIHVLMLSQ